MKCLNVIVFYNNREEVENYISEVASIANGRVDIIVVVNSDKRKEINRMVTTLKKKEIDCFQILNYGENVGYLNAVLKTIKKIDINEYDYIILSNTDIQYDTIDFYQNLAQKKYSYDVGCVAPSVFASKSNSYSNPHYCERIPKERLERLVRIFKYPVLGKIYLKLAEFKASRKRTEMKPSCYVYSPHGCFMIFTKVFIKKIMGYEYGAKLYSEESVIGELLQKNKMRCFYDNSVSVIHNESSVTGKIDYKLRFSAWRESLIYILSEFYD